MNNNGRASRRAALSVFPVVLSPLLSSSPPPDILDQIRQATTSMSAATPSQATSLLLTDLPSETLSAIVFLLPPIDALRFSHTCRALHELATVNAHSLWSLYVKQTGTSSPAPSSPAPPSALPSLAHKDALQAFLALVKQSTCSPDHKWHPEAAKASDKPHVQACEACIDARLYTSASTLGTEARRALLVRALQREGIDLRSDSRLCNGFIRSGHGYVPDIVQTM